MKRLCWIIHYPQFAVLVIALSLALETASFLSLFFIDIVFPPGVHKGPNIKWWRHPPNIALSLCGPARPYTLFGPVRLQSAFISIIVGYRPKILTGPGFRPYRVLYAWPLNTPDSL